MRLNRLVATLAIAVGLLTGAAVVLACATAATQTDCCPQDGSPCADTAGSASACCAAPLLLPGAAAPAARVGLDLRPDTGSFPVTPIPTWVLNPAPATDASCLVLADESLLFRDSQPLYLRTNRLRL